MRFRIAGLFGFLCLLISAPASANMNKTLDISLGFERGPLEMNDERLSTVFDAAGVVARVGATMDGLRFGAGLSTLYPVGLTARAQPGARAYHVRGETYLGLTLPKYWAVRPFVELRGHLDRLAIGGGDGCDSCGFGLTRAGLGGRVGLLAALSHYFFVDVGVGLDFVGTDRLHVSMSIGLPIQFSHL